MSRLTNSLLRNPTKVALLTLGKVSHGACRTTAVRKAAHSPVQDRVAPLEPLAPQDGAYHSRLGHVPRR